MTIATRQAALRGYTIPARRALVGALRDYLKLLMDAIDFVCQRYTGNSETTEVTSDRVRQAKAILIVRPRRGLRWCRILVKSFGVVLPFLVPLTFDQSAMSASQSCLLAFIVLVVVTILLMVLTVFMDEDVRDRAP